MDGVIFTSEPMLTRALAAEIRHASDKFLNLVARRSRIADLGELDLESVECEAAGNIDVILTLAGGRKVGIEAKLDHQITLSQLANEKKAVDHLFLLVLAAVDASDHEHAVDGVITWEEAIACFDDSRLTVADISALPPQKVQVERDFRKTQPLLLSQLGSGWEVTVGRGGGGLPAITIESPKLADNRRLRGQVQVVGRSMPAHADDLRFEYHVGIETRPTRADFPKAETAVAPPEWVTHLELLRDKVLTTDNPEFTYIRKGRAGNGRKGVGKNKSLLVAQFLSDAPWLARGYFDWSLGPKSMPVPKDGLPNLATRAASLMLLWFNASVT